MSNFLISRTADNGIWREGEVMDTFAGVRVYESNLATTCVPVKRSKNKRIQKKFIKKFGYKYVPGCVQTPMGIFMHPALFAKLKEAANADKLD